MHEEKKKILVLVADYPNNNGGVALMYVHVRNKFYVKQGIDVTVLNFNAKEDYLVNGIKVISYKKYQADIKEYDVLISHAPNLRNHYLFLKKYGKRFKHFMFFFHGHEIVKINEAYSKSYDFIKDKCLVKRLIQDVYDKVKLAVWRHYYPSVAKKSNFIFVSNCFWEEAQKYLRLNKDDLDNHVHIINNSVGQDFQFKSYSVNEKKEYDFITIRSRIDESVYCIDLLCELAIKNPKCNFLLIGKGSFFQYKNKPDNITWIDSHMSHERMMKYIDSARCALMLTRRDTQGVMACELAVYGIPLITSDLPICHEIFDNIESVAYIDNNNIKEIDVKKVFATIDKVRDCKVNSFSENNTMLREVEIINLSETIYNET